MSSIRSSSGVSSTSSLSYCNSDLETTREISEGGHPGYSRGSPSCPPTPRSHPDVLIAVSEPEDKTDLHVGSPPHHQKNTDNRETNSGPPPPVKTRPAVLNCQSLATSSGSSNSSQSQMKTHPSVPPQPPPPPPPLPVAQPSSIRSQRKLMSVRSLTSGNNLASEDEEFDSLAYQRATGSMKLRRNKPEITCESNNKAESKDDSLLLNHERQRKESSTTTTSSSNTNGSKKPKDLLNFLLTDGSLESS